MTCRTLSLAVVLFTLVSGCSTIRQMRFEEACAAGDLATAKSLFASGVNVNANDKGMTPLGYAIAADSQEVVSFLLGKGANARYADDDGFSVLHHAAAGGRLEIVRLLIDHGASPLGKDKQGRTALDVARESQQVATMKLLEGFNKPGAAAP